MKAPWPEGSQTTCTAVKFCIKMVKVGHIQEILKELERHLNCSKQCYKIQQCSIVIPGKSTYLVIDNGLIVSSLLYVTLTIKQRFYAFWVIQGAGYGILVLIHGHDIFFHCFFSRNVFFIVHYKLTPVNEWCICHCSRKFCFVGKSEHNNPVLSVKKVSKQKSVLILLIGIADIT